MAINRWLLSYHDHKRTNKKTNKQTALKTVPLPRVAEVITHAAVAGVMFSALFVCMSVYPHDISKTDVDVPRGVHEIHYFGVKRSKVKVTCHKTNVGVGLCTLVSAGSTPSTPPP